jgi:hypothetical protein
MYLDQPGGWFQGIREFGMLEELGIQFKPLLGRSEKRRQGRKRGEKEEERKRQERTEEKRERRKERRREGEHTSGEITPS